MSELDYSYLEETDNNSHNIIINFNKNSYTTTFELNHTHNFYQFLLKLKQYFKSKSLPSHLIFFLRIKEKILNKQINNYESFCGIMPNISNSIFNIEENNNFILIDNDGSIIRILDKLADYFEIIIQNLNYMDDHLNFKNKESLYLSLKQLINLYSSIRNYMKDDKVIFFKEEYPFSNETVFYNLSIVSINGIFNAYYRKPSKQHEIIYF